MQLKIYFGDKPVFLCDEITPEIEEYRHHPDAVYIDEISTPAINSLLHEIAKNEFHAGILVSDDFKALKKSFFKHFLLVQTGGGVVVNEQHEILMIFRRGKWDLPKGKIDEGESLEECAVREVIEETGLKNVKLKKSLIITYHTYNEFGKHILKESHWYTMSAAGSQQLTPQKEEDITAIEWVKDNAIEKKLDNSFPLIKDIIDAYRSKRK